MEPGHGSISLRRQCDLLDLPRSTAYYAPLPETAENLRLMRAIDAVYLGNPSYGSRSIAAVLANGGWAVNRKRVQRLMRARPRRRLPELRLHSIRRWRRSMT